MDSNSSLPSLSKGLQDDDLERTTTCIDCSGVVSRDEMWYHWVVCPEAQLVLTPAPTVGARVTIGVNGEEEMERNEEVNKRG